MTHSSSHSPSYPTKTQQDWHSLTAETALTTLEGNDEVGLSTAVVTERQTIFGLNELQEMGGRSSLLILWEQFTNIMLVMLIAVAVVSGVLDLRTGTFPKDAIAIFAIVILNGLLGFLQESRAEKALAALKKLSSPKVRVLRNGVPAEVDGKELVPGDLMLLEAGVQVAADGRLLEVQNLQIREATLTGEAEAVVKQSDLILPADAPLGDRRNLVFQGTEVVQGRGKVLVTKTGMDTEIGRIATLIQSVETEPTPLQQRMTQLGNVLVSSSLALVALVMVVGIVRTGWSYFEELLEVSLSMAVAVVPEGLPAVVTVTLAIGTQRMVRRQALIRRLPAVETLGSVTTICSDKTGTLTQNKMVVQQLQTGQSTYQVSGNGYTPVGEISITDNSPGSVETAVQPLLMACTLCNDAVLQHQDDQWIVLGDPTEGALLALAGKGGLDQATLTLAMPRLAEIPFSSERKRMAVIVQDSADAQSYTVYSKGSAEILLAACNTRQLGDEIQDLTPEQRETILATNDRWASQGLRVLGFAYRQLTHPDLAIAETDLTWLGLVAMLDAPRPEVKEAVKRCKQAGIRPVMITGDHPLTAQAIAEELGISEVDQPIFTGKDIESMGQIELENVVHKVSVYARVAPEHKLWIVNALQNRGEFVAMTGDGVNDAPALKQADIGIAMGITGTDVSKEASDMILLDDNFATIVAAIEEGRVVYDNIRRFIKYILGSNIGEVLVIASAPLLGLGGVPLAPLQILWMNLVTDGLPALALAMEPAEPNIMSRPPFNPKESIFSRGLGFYMVRIGLIFAVLTITLMIFAYQEAQQSGDSERWKTMVFTTLCLAQMGHALAIRSDSQFTFQLNPFSNPYILAAVGLTSLLQMALIYVEPLRVFFGTQFLNLRELGICIAFSALMFLWIELEKGVIKYMNARKNCQL